MLGWIILIALAVFFYRAADFEDLPAPMAWAGASVALYIGAGGWLEWGICGALGSQLLLLVVMAACIARERGAWTFSVKDIKARRRRARGRCPQCGYDLQGLTRSKECPECGAAVTADTS